MSRQWLAQGFCYVLLALFIGYFSGSPAYSPLSDQEAVIILTLRHAGRLLGECRQRSEEELAQLPPNMRVSEVCPRERSPLWVELLVNGEPCYGEWLPPSGFQKDGMASLYRRFKVRAVETIIEVRMKDHVNSESFDYTLRHKAEMISNRVLAIDFDTAKKSFVIL